MTLDGRAWARAWTASIGRAVKRERQERGLSQQDLADRTERYGYPISRNTVVNIEGGRAETITVQQLAILAAALTVSPTELAFDLREQDDVEVVPGETGWRFWAAEWFSGHQWLEPEGAEELGLGEVPNSLLNNWRMHAALVDQLYGLVTTLFMGDEDPRVHESHNARIADMERAVAMFRDGMRAQQMPLPPLPEGMAHLDRARVPRGGSVATIHARSSPPEQGGDKKTRGWAVQEMLDEFERRIRPLELEVQRQIAAEYLAAHRETDEARGERPSTIPDSLDDKTVREVFEAAEAERRANPTMREVRDGIDTEAP